jgi:hypothetical protein
MFVAKIAQVAVWAAALSSERLRAIVRALSSIPAILQQAL